MHKLLLVFGTRPELIKLAPIIHEFQSRNERDRLFIVNTNQHKDFIQADLEYFKIDVDHHFNLTRDNDSLSLLNGLLLLEFNRLKSILTEQKIKLEAIIGQGDTCTSFASAHYAFYEGIPFLHVEAGLRTNDFGEPFPEEYFRKTISTISTFHFAPTLHAEQMLIAEGIPEKSIVLTGNTVIDNLRQLKNSTKLDTFKHTEHPLILITIHRRENIKENLAAITDRILHYVSSNPDKSFVWISNPGYKIDVHSTLSNLSLVQPVSFFEMIEYYKCAQLIITDSGGIQEEAAYLGIPTLLFRTKTERIEGITSGISKYIEESDDHLDSIITNLTKHQSSDYNPIYGDGYASKRIVDFVLNSVFNLN